MKKIVLKKDEKEFIQKKEWSSTILEALRKYKKVGADNVK